MRRQRYNVHVQASAPDEVQAMSPPPEDELICLVKAEIPEQLPRPYLIKDLYQWSCINLQDNGREQYGLPLAVVQQGAETFATASIGRTYQIYNCTRLSKHG